MPSYSIWIKTTYPITIIKDRYSGMYSGGFYLAFALGADAIPHAISANDNACGAFWDNEDYLCFTIGKGRDCNEALFDLYTKLKEKK